jgi:hypothetical protein
LQNFITMLRGAKITYSDGTVIETSLAGHLTDREINKYFAIGKEFNIGNVNDNMQTVVKCEIAPLKGLTVNVYREFNRDGSVIDCTNNGLSSKCHVITLCGPDMPEIFEASPDAPAFRLVKRQLFGSEYLHIEPWERPTGNGWMYGGNIADTSDSRKPWKYPVHIHDRQEF